MKASYFWDLISVSLIGLVIYPIIQYLITFRPFYLLLLGGIVLTDLLTKLFKYLTSDSTLEFLKRPKDASNCDILCQDGAQGNKPGMPSGHMAILTFAVVLIYLVDVHHSGTSIVRPLYIIFALTYTMLMAYSRYKKHCHDELQLIAGIVWGAIIAGIVYAVFGRMLTPK